MKLKKFKTKKILITGASSGIGKAIALLLSKEDTHLYLTGRDTEKITSVSQECLMNHQNATHETGNESCFSVNPFIVDFDDHTSIDKFVEAIHEKGIVFDYILLNAGVSQRSLTLETDISVDRRIMETNFFGPVYFIKQIADMLLSGKKIHIAITSSISGLFGFPLRSAYCASKHALFGFFETLELENRNIRTTFLIPGRINTPISLNALTKDGSTHSKSDIGQANGMDVDKCARIAIRAIAKGKHRRLICGKEWIIVYAKRFIPPLFFKLARNISAT